MLALFATGGSCGGASTPDPDCGDAIYAPSAYPPAGDLDVESGYTATGYAVSFSKTYEGLCLAR